MEYIETKRTVIQEIFENMWIQHPQAKKCLYMYMYSDLKYDYFKDKFTKEYIKAKRS